MVQRILVVDDDREIVRLVKAYLERSGYEVLVAYDGESALHMLRRERPDLMLLDLMLPGRDGLDVTRVVRSDGSLAALPIIVLTARVEDQDKIVGLELGADDYVTKPFNPGEVVARVRAVLRRVHGEIAQPMMLRAGDVVVDLDRHQVTVAGQVVLIAFGITTGALYLNGELSGITAAAMVVVLLRVVEAAGSLSLLATPIAAVERLLTELRDLVDEDTAAAAPGPVRTESAETGRPPAVRLTGVDYRYADGTQALDGIDLDIAPGQITVLVGASGSGKSTLLDVLAGLRDPSSGQVLLDHEPADPGRRIAGASVVFQTTALRPGTLRENVVTAVAPDLAEIADLAQLAPVLDALPNGWDSRVGDGANALSGGERQRVGLARALAKPAGLLLVDEATSALDVITERAVADSLRTIRGTRTVVAVTHRPALVALADAVVVLDGGRVVDAGGVDELLARGGVFADLWERWRESEGWQV